MPDPVRASEGAWLPFMREALGADAGAVVVGHSSGAAAAMRLAETDRLAGARAAGRRIALQLALTQLVLMQRCVDAAAWLWAVRK